MTLLQHNRPISVLAVDDHPLILEGIAAVFEGMSEMNLVGACDGRQALALYQQHLPDVTLMDLQMPGVSGLEAIELIRQYDPHARIVVLTTYKGDVHALRAIKAGAVGYVLKNMMRTDLLETIRGVHAGHRRIPAEVAMELAEYMSEVSLTPRETEVLKLAAVGKSNKRIGAGLDISEDTVKVHMKNILAKLHAADRTHAVTIAVRRGILQF
ncbi:response regulator [Amantichitinum ursilacus]|uniref:Transcriptional regulatory protein DegU n=1 Tax=Amantichitinum ursilacus TaxID=857265 RepID=A0A0N0XNU6_9NEIS|nr:response regulator transcription factor [Amantichitinum ursilacus]KPC55414.1 Transcriptional regulatory protein DegU [Amantichitinum ursilacus]